MNAPRSTLRDDISRLVDDKELAGPYDPRGNASLTNFINIEIQKLKHFAANPDNSEGEILKHVINTAAAIKAATHITGGYRYFTNKVNKNLLFHMRLRFQTFDLINKDYGNRPYISPILDKDFLNFRFLGKRYDDLEQLIKTHENLFCGTMKLNEYMTSIKIAFDYIITNKYYGITITYDHYVGIFTQNNRFLAYIEDKKNKLQNKDFTKIKDYCELINDEIIVSRGLLSGVLNKSYTFHDRQSFLDACKEGSLNKIKEIREKIGDENFKLIIKYSNYKSLSEAFINNHFGVIDYLYECIDIKCIEGKLKNQLDNYIKDKKVDLIFEGNTNVADSLHGRITSFAYGYQIKHLIEPEIKGLLEKRFKVFFSSKPLEENKNLQKILEKIKNKEPNENFSDKEKIELFEFLSQPRDKIINMQNYLCEKFSSIKGNEKYGNYMESLFSGSESDIYSFPIINEYADLIISVLGKVIEEQSPTNIHSPAPRSRT